MMDVVVAIDAEELKDEAAFIAHLRQEGLEHVEEEEGLVFAGSSQTPVTQTRAYIFEVVTKAIEQSPASFCHMVCMIGENPMEGYRFDADSRLFVEAE
jgi:hypothetical protein